MRRRNEFGSWVQSVQYEPRLEDDGKALTCSLAAGSKGAEDSITMRMLMNTMEGKAWKLLNSNYSLSIFQIRLGGLAPSPFQYHIHATSLL